MTQTRHKHTHITIDGPPPFAMSDGMNSEATVNMHFHFYGADLNQRDVLDIVRQITQDVNR